MPHDGIASSILARSTNVGGQITEDRRQIVDITDDRKLKSFCLICVILQSVIRFMYSVIRLLNLGPWYTGNMPRWHRGVRGSIPLGSTPLTLDKHTLLYYPVQVCTG